MSPSRWILALVLCLSTTLALAADGKRTGETFAEPQVQGTLRVLLAGGGNSHDFEKFFHQADAATFRAAKMDPVYTESAEEAIALLSQADVLVLSSNQSSFGESSFQTALRTFADAGKGIVVLHPGAWFNWAPASGYNQTFVGGGARSHDKLGLFTVNVKDAAHPVMKDVPATVEIRDELYHMNFDPAAQVQILAETSPSAITKKEHASVWIVAHPKARIIGIAPGHDAGVHGLAAFQTILTNAVKWVSAK